MTNPVEKFQNQCEKHLEAIRELIDAMPYQGDTSDNSQKVRMMIELEGLRTSIDSVKPIDFAEVDLSDGDLWLKDTAETLFNDEPHNGLYEVEVWTNESEDPTTAIEVYRCLICAESQKVVEGMATQIGEMLGIDDDLFMNIESIQVIHPPKVY